MNDNTTMRMLLTTAVMAAVAALFAGGANAMLLDVEGGSTGGAGTEPTAQPQTIPYLSHGIGVDESQFSGQPSSGLTGVHAALERNRESGSATAGLDPAIRTAIAAKSAEGSSVGLTGDSALTRVTPQPVGLSGDSAATRYPGQVTFQAASGDNETDWTSFGAGAAMAGLLAAAVAGVVLTTRRRGVALP